MKSRIWKPVATGLAVLLTGVIAGTIVMNSAIEAEAADTFLGIQNLINEVSEDYQENQGKYTILEIVPDREAAEIGYLFDGCEPKLSEWDEDEMRWVGWRERLAACADSEARKKLIEGDGTEGSGLKNALKSYYTEAGLTEGPVDIASGVYDEVNEPTEGYERIDIPGMELHGYFELLDSVGTGYQLVFRSAVLDADAFVPGKYYQVKESLEIVDTVSGADQISKDDVAPNASIYTKNSLGEYEYLGIWKALQSKVFLEETEQEEASEVSGGEVGEETGEASTENQTEESVDGTGEESGEASTKPPTEASSEESSEATADVSTEEASGETEKESAEGTTEGTSYEEGTDSLEGAVTDSVTVPSMLTAPEGNVLTVLDSDNVSSGNMGDAETDTEGETEESGPEESETGTEEASVEETGTEESGSQGTKSPLDVDAPESYYMVTFTAITDVNAIPADTVLYVVEDIQKSEEGFYRFQAVDDESYETYQLDAQTIYCKNTFTNREWFKKFVLNMAADEFESFPVEVFSYTPDELNALSANGALPDFDFLYINSGKSAGWSYSSGRDEAAQKGSDLSLDVSRTLFETVKAKKLPCLVDGNIIFKQGDTAVSTTIEKNEELTGTNIFKLCAMFGQKSLDEVSAASADAFNGLVTDALWESLADGYEDGNFTTDQVYFYTKDSSIVNDGFGTSMFYRDGMEMPKGFQKVLDEIELENLYRQSDTSGNHGELPKDISQATVVRHIMNYRNRRNAEAKATINVLEIQPAKTKDGKATLTLEQMKEWAPDVEAINVTVMTTAEFIGKVETLNDKYDLIYLGTCKDHMNTVKGDQESPAAGSTVFNDHSMDGLIYFHTGDMRYSSLELSGMLNTDYVGGNRANDVYYYTPVRYSGNDITKEKKEALISYLNGSYPVVAAKDFFESPATVYQDIDYKGYSVNLEVGEYHLADLERLGIKNDDITSLKVKDGYRVICYWDDDFASESITLTDEISYIGWKKSAEHAPEDWNDAVSAIKVELIPESAPQKAIDEDHIDNSSYMYEFVKQALDGKYTNFYAFDEIDEDSQLFQFYLNRPKARLVNTSANGSDRDGIYYIRDVNGRYTLEYHFVIENEGAASADTRYQCKFYIDVNADGKFSSQEQLADVGLSSGGGSVAADQLYAGREYVMIRDVPDGYKGVLPWKVEISQVNNPNIYCFMDGYTKLEGMEKETLNILQICRDQVLEPDPDWWGREHERLYSLAEQINGKKTQYDTLELNSTGAYPVKTEAYSTDELVEGYESMLYHVLIYGGVYEGVEYKGIADDFEIDVDFMTIRRFENEYRAGHVNMADYNMLILGFSDAYGDFTIIDGEEKSPIGAIVDFINSGKSVLFAHDTTSYFNYPKGRNSGIANRATGEMKSTNQYHNASTLNTYIRGLVGMDRYGVMSMAVLRNGTGLNTASTGWAEVASSGKDMAYRPKSNRTEIVPLTQGYTYSIINSKDEHTAQNVSAVEYTPEQTGLSSVWKNEYLNLKYDTVYYHDNYTDPAGVGYPDEGEIPANYNGEITNLLVTQVNEGQITEYPYKLAPSFQVSTTHGQYYQLDFTADDDKDGQSDLVVWYCLGGRNGNSGYQETIYSMSPNDVSNNYYIYNKGNITYTGMGHAAGRNNENAPYSTNNCTVEEAKLFINTMIAAYNAGIKPPSVTIQENGQPGAPKQTVLYRYYDEDFALDTVDNAANPYENIYFTVRDVNFVKGSRNISVNVYYDAPDSAQNIVVDGQSKPVNALERVIYNAGTNAQTDPDHLESGGIYYIRVPKTVLQNCDTGLKLYFEVQSLISSNNKVYQTDKVYAQLEVLKTYLFDLN